MAPWLAGRSKCFVCVADVMEDMVSCITKLATGTSNAVFGQVLKSVSVLLKNVGLAMQQLTSICLFKLQAISDGGVVR